MPANAASGPPPAEVLVAPQIEEVYQARVTTYAHPEMPKPQITLMPVANEHQQRAVITRENFSIEVDYIQLKSDIPLKTISTVNPHSIALLRTKSKICR